MKTIHINLVSDQLIPNLIPTLSDASCIGVILVLGDNSREQEADRLTQIYQRHGMKILWQSKGESSTSFDTLYLQAEQLLNELEQRHADCQWILNATCGTKPMSLAFTNVFNQNKQSLVIYTDTQNREIPVIKQGVNFSLPFRSVLQLDDYLLANHFELESLIDSTNDDDIQQRADLTCYVARQFQTECRGMLGGMLAMAVSAVKDFPINQWQLMNSVPVGAFAVLYHRLHDEKLIEWEEGSKEICFLTEDAARYLGGGWLEEFTYLIASKCGAEYVAMNIFGHWLKGRHGHHEKEASNEFDVLILHNNQLLTIECKAGQWHEKNKSQEIINKLDLLSHKLGGLFGQNLLVTAQHLSDAANSRAKQNHIHCCENVTSNSLKHEIKAWLQRVS